MNRTFFIKTALLLIVIVTLVGCKSKQETPGTASKQQVQGANSSARSQNATDKKFISGENASGGPTIPPKDLNDTRAAALQVLSRLQSGDFASIYKDAATGFKQIGPEAAFVAKFAQTRQKVGVLNNPKEISIGVRPDKSYVMVYRVENDHFNTDMRLSFTRSSDGKMELAGLNQHDEPKK
jgi:uncharacterized lipoprotein NlpE involved in copper resistance